VIAAEIRVFQQYLRKPDARIRPESTFLAVIADRGDGGRR
jgi:hypothetical protein